MVRNIRLGPGDQATSAMIPRSGRVESTGPPHGLTFTWNRDHIAWQASVTLGIIDRAGRKIDLDPTLLSSFTAT